MSFFYVAEVIQIISAQLDPRELALADLGDKAAGCELQAFVADGHAVDLDAALSADDE